MGNARGSGREYEPGRGDVPPRSRIVLPEPEGVGTADVEAFTSLLPRTAIANDQALGLFTRFVLAPLLGRSDVRGASRDDWGRYFAAIFRPVRGTLDGCGAHARTWIEALESISLRSGLSRHTFLWLADVLAPHGLTLPIRRWCPACLEDQRRRLASPDDPNQRAVHEPLLWRLGPLEVCLAHDRPVRLESACPACGQESSILATWGVPGRCAACGERVGRPIAELAQVEPTAWQRFVWTQARRLVESCQSEEPLAATLRDVGAAVTGARTLRRWSMQELASRTGYSVAAVSLWSAGRRRMSVGAALRVAFVLGVHVDALLQGRVEIDEDAAREQSPAPVRRTVDWTAVEQDLRRALESRRPPSLSTVATRHGAARKEVVRRLPELAADLAERHRSWRSRLRHARLEWTEREIRQAVRELSERGLYPGRDRVVRHIRRRPDMRHPRLQAAWKAALTELRLL